MFFLRTFPVIFLCLFVGVLRAEEVRDDPNLDLEDLTTQMEKLSDIRKQKRVEYLTSVRAGLVKAVQGSGTAGNYMIECMREVQFAGKKNENAEYSDWKKENRNLFTDRNFEQASDLHLQYLVLTLDRSAADSAEKMASKIWTYLDKLDQAKDLYRFQDTPEKNTKFQMVNEKQEVTGQIVGDLSSLHTPGVRPKAGPGEIHQYVEEFLNTSVDSGFPGMALKLQGQLGGLDDWCMEPGDYSQILERSIRPYLRKAKDPKLPWTWDREIAYLRAVAQAQGDPRQLTKFDNETYPRLLWKKADDMAVIGMPNKALKMQIDIAKRYTAHPDFNEWTKEIDTKIADLKNDGAEGETVESGGTEGNPEYFGSKTDQNATPTPTPLPGSLPTVKALL